MNDLLTKFKELCTQEIELPDSGTITTTQLNVDFQNKLFNVIKSLKDETSISINYLQYLNNFS